MAVVCFRLAVMALPFIWGVTSALPAGDNVEFTKIILNNLPMVLRSGSSLRQN